MTGGALWRRYVRLSQDMTGVGEFINDPTDDWDCAPTRDDGWIDTYVQQHVDNEQHRVSWDERHKKIASASRKATESWVPPREEKRHE